MKFFFCHIKTNKLDFKPACLQQTRDQTRPWLFVGTNLIVKKLSKNQLNLKLILTMSSPTKQFVNLKSDYMKNIHTTVVTPSASLSTGAAYDSKSAINGEHFTTQTTTPPIVSANQTKACSTNNIPVLDQGWQVRLPKAPSCFLLNSTNGKQLQKMKPRKPQCSKTEKRWNNTCCKTVFFIGK